MPSALLECHSKPLSVSAFERHAKTTENRFVPYSFLGPFATPYPLQHANSLAFLHFKNLNPLLRVFRDRLDGIGDDIKIRLA